MKFECCRNCRHYSDGITVPENNPCSNCHSEYLDGVTGIRAIPTRWESMQGHVNTAAKFSIDGCGRYFMTFTEEYTTAISENKEHIIEEIIETTVNELNESVIKHTISFDRKQACDAIRNAIPMKPIGTSFGYACSMCKSAVHSRYQYCCTCGQKLDWKDILVDEED